MAKSADAFRTISEVADDLGIQKHVLRFWEVKFSQIRPMKRGGGRRYYRPEDLELLRGIRQLLHRDGYTIKGVQKILREQGVEAVKQRMRSEEEQMAAQSPEAETAVVATSGAAEPQARSGRVRSRRQPAPAVDRTEALRTILNELVACREILLGNEPPVSEAAEPRRGRARRSA